MTQTSVGFLFEQASQSRFLFLYELFRDRI